MSAAKALERAIHNVLAVHERAALRSFALFAAVASAVVLVAQADIDLPMGKRAAVVISSATLVSVGWSFAHANRKSESIHSNWVRALAALCVLAPATWTFAFGFTPAVAVACVLFVVCFTQLAERTTSLAFAPLIAATQIAAGAAAGTASWRIALATLAAYAGATMFARAQRSSLSETMKQAVMAVSDVWRAESELALADRSVDQLLQLEVGPAGRYTGTALASYTVAELIGRGAMAEVYAARSKRSDQHAAVKFLQQHALKDENLVLRFLREGESVAKLCGENIVSIYEVGKAQDGAPYIAMELLRGHDLAWHLQQRGRLALGEVVALANDVAEGLEVARLAGVVHRDLKPQNLFFAQRPRQAPVWKILDFGVSRLVHSNGTLTQEALIGTPGYMSPEQAAAQAATHQSDVFALGAVIYKALTGGAPFTGPDTPQVLFQVVYSNPVSPSRLNPELPPDVDLVLAIALAKDKADRFRSARDLAAAFRMAASNELDPALRLQARTLLAALPWGASSRASTVDLPTAGSLSS